jgi:hypothetical protein
MKTDAVLRNAQQHACWPQCAVRNLGRSGRFSRPDSRLRMNGKPYRRRIGARPFNAVALMS